ncbi:MAG: metal-dependent transcriptional regulator [Synergistaceae bacterium]|jgi:DtxR family Mn-dependent transcriptional regulator|nr:metal-dependent transcriptional regulator [Synergistaceae bacterium]
MITARIEDYLKEIFLLESTGRDVTVTDLAKRLGITKGTVTVTVQKLAREKLLNHERYGSLHLTVEGRRKGLLVYRRHEGLRVFFHELLGVDRERSSEMACNTEHYMDAVTGDRLYSMLDFFRRARADKESWVDELFNAMEARVLLPNPLSVLEDGQKGFVTRLTANEKLRKRLQNTGFTAGAGVTCLDASLTGSLCVALNGRELTIPRNEATAIWLRMA